MIEAASANILGGGHLASTESSLAILGTSIGIRSSKISKFPEKFLVFSPVFSLGKSLTSLVRDSFSDLQQCYWPFCLFAFFLFLGVVTSSLFTKAFFPWFILVARVALKKASESPESVEYQKVEQTRSESCMNLQIWFTFKAVSCF